MKMYLVSLRAYSDTYYRFVMARDMLTTRTMENLRELASKKGFRVDIEGLDTIEDAERFLNQLEK